MTKTLKKYLAVAAGALAFGGFSGAALASGADLERKLVINEELEMLTKVEASDDSPFTEVLSGWLFRSDETQELQTDDFLNPGFLWVERGEELWSTVDGEAGESCESCHGDAAKAMAGVRASMPKWSAEKGRPLTLEQYVNQCRTERMKAKEWKWESHEMLSMTSFVGLQSRGQPVKVDFSQGDMETWRKQGETLYYTRTGQLDLSCASCHEANYGKFLRADHLSQGQTNGFPTYRLKWQGLGSLHRRLQGCVKDTRAETYDIGSDEFVALETYLSWRGAGLSVETPSVRQ